jgi:hypothetical protein
LIASAHAQIPKESIWLGGSIGYGSTKNDYANSTLESKSHTVSFSPAVGVAVKDNLIVGVMLSYTNKKTKNIGYVEKAKETSTGGGVFVRQYVPIVNKLYLFGEASALFRSLKSNEELSYNNPSMKNKTKGWDAGLALTPGVALGINKKVQLESGFNSLFSAVYNKRKIDNSGTADDYTQKNFNAGIALDNESLFYVGVRFLLSKG